MCKFVVNIRCGPLVHIWCMRYESKHSYFKQLARITGNFKNIQKTLAYRHQRYMCYQLYQAEKYLCPRESCGKRVSELFHVLLVLLTLDVFHIQSLL